MFCSAGPRNLTFSNSCGAGPGGRCPSGQPCAAVLRHPVQASTRSEPPVPLLGERGGGGPDGLWSLRPNADTARGGPCCQFTDVETEAQTCDVTAQSRLDAECGTRIQNQARQWLPLCQPGLAFKCKQELPLHRDVDPVCFRLRWRESAHLPGGLDHSVPHTRLLSWQRGNRTSR